MILVPEEKKTRAKLQMSLGCFGNLALTMYFWSKKVKWKQKGLNPYSLVQLFVYVGDG